MPAGDWQAASKQVMIEVTLYTDEVRTMTEPTVGSQEQGTPEGEPRKVSLAEAMKQKLQQKQQAQAGGGKQKHDIAGNQATMRSQNTKKINNQRKRMGV